uniref:Uncharacterized protein n=1 Tax=Anguilla anguilla TaxID=7936 RepID=A0A0E9XCN0_ANGAN
MVEVLTLY